MPRRSSTSTPPAVTFRRPGAGWFLAIDGGVAALAVLGFHEGVYRRVRAVAPLPEQDQLRRLVGGTVAAHLVEAAGARRAARRRGLPPRDVRRWTRQTFVVGFPSLLALRRLPEGASGTLER